MLSCGSSIPVEWRSLLESRSQPMEQVLSTRSHTRLRQARSMEECRAALIPTIRRLTGPGRPEAFLAVRTNSRSPRT